MTAHSPEELHLVDCSAGRTQVRAEARLHAARCLPWRHSALDRPAIYIVLMDSSSSLMVASGERWHASSTSGGLGAPWLHGWPARLCRSCTFFRMTLILARLHNNHRAHIHLHATSPLPLC
jgi:hypothetical protein